MSKLKHRFGEPWHGEHTWHDLREYERVLREYNDLLLKADSTQKARVADLEKDIRERRAKLEEAYKRNRKYLGMEIPALDEEDTEELNRALRRYKRYLRDVPMDLDDPLFRERQQFLTEYISEIQEELDLRGVAPAPPTAAQQAVAAVTSAADIKTELILGLMQACEEKKKTYPRELHADIDREYRKAIDKIRRES